MLTNKTNKTRNKRIAIPPICKFVLLSLINVVWLKPFMLITIKMSLVKITPRKQVWLVSDFVMWRHFDEPSWPLVNNVLASKIPSPILYLWFKFKSSHVSLYFVLFQNLCMRACMSVLFQNSFTLIFYEVQELHFNKQRVWDFCQCYGFS